jgi:SAM-dependent methyltransferase
MQSDLRFVPSRQLLNELAIRAPKVLRAYWKRSRAAAAPLVADSVFGTWSVGGRDVPLSSAYRRSIKHWVRYFWQTEVLTRLNERAALPEAAASLARSLATARTLPLPLPELTAMLAPMCERHPAIVRPAPHTNDAAAGPVWEIVPTPNEVHAIAAAYREHAAGILDRCGIRDAARARARVLEIGSGTGYATMAMVALGVAESVGVDMDLEACAGRVERAHVAMKLFGASGSPANLRFDTGDAHALPFGDGTFDLVHHASVLEHIADPGVALREMLRVLKPGGRAWIEVGPWFAPNGAHMACTLDFPWGHVLLSPDEFHQYVRTHRPHEADEAWSYYQHGFQTPRLTAGAVEARVVEAGFRIEDWQESRARYQPHYAYLTPELLAQCRERHPDLTVRDLMSTAYVMVLRKL